MPETSEHSEALFLLAHCRAELIRAWSAGPRVGYREWKRRKRTLRSIRATVEAQHV